VRHVLIAIVALALVALLEAAYHIYRWRDERARDELRRRIKAIADEPIAGGPSLLRAGRFAAAPALDEFVRSLPLADRLELLLLQTDSPLTVAQVIGYSLLSGAAGLLLSLVLRVGLPGAVVLGAATLAVPVLLLLGARDRRNRKLSEQLPEALDMVARSLRAGHALSSAFELAAGEMPAPVAVEFGRAFEAQRLGIPTDEAIVQITARAPKNRDLKIFAVSAIIQKETGGNLAEILSQLAETIRARYRFQGKLRALTAEGRASAVIVGAMPFIIGAALAIMNPEYLRPLATTGIGQVITLAAGASWLLGVAWLHRMTKLDL
jgi:tight adherence protein B